MEHREILYYQRSDVDFLAQCLDMLSLTCKLMTNDEILNNLYFSMLARLQSISPSYNYSFDVDYATVAFRSDV